MRLGILGSGQLASMLATAAKNCGHRVAIFTDDKMGPAIADAHETIFGNLKDHHALREFFARVDVVTFENEFIDIDAIDEARRNSSDLEILPSPATVFLLSDKLEQKNLLSALKIPCAQFINCTNALEKKTLHSLIENFGGNAVIKWSRFGYDGKGVFIMRAPFLAQDLDAAIHFCEQGHDKGAAIFIEEAIDFDRELAMVAVRSKHGDFVHYPLVISHQERGICKEVIGPATLLGIDEGLEIEAAAAMKLFAEHVNYVGAFAFEFFATIDGKLIVNEIAPRVHNSAHYTLDAFEIDQFAQHIGAITGEQLSVCQKTNFFAMRNLLGPADFVGNVDPPRATITSDKQLTIHWYKKRESRPRRKLGHVNALAKNLSELEEARARMRDIDITFFSVVGPPPFRPRASTRGSQHKIET